ncbi:MAG: iron-sulfur cluster co-chaperone HscB C-terminal domain-containing protein [Planctomycetota bacterium]
MPSDPLSPASASAAASGAAAPCGRCGEPLTFALACSKCGALFPEAAGDAFDLLGLPPAFELDAARLQNNYLGLSRLAHPDRHVNAGEEAQEAAEAVMALANRSRAQLEEPRERAEVLIARILREANLPPAEKMPPPPGFLMEIMELTERLAAADDGQKAALADNIRTELAQLETTLAEVLATLPPADPADTAARAREVLDQMAYWRRLLENATGTGGHRLVQ